MLDISQFQLFVASFMWTKSLLCSFCKCLNCRVDLNPNNVNNKATDFYLHEPIILISFGTVINIL